ncbi:hypothetical protein [Actinoallomurus sp. NPDC052274]|uniref:hypothetical protein n=1 Tax=Actinoallomurus sp. NPDC052274 TaxID=3155420 RepID=UPI0034342424
MSVAVPEAAHRQAAPRRGAGHGRVSNALKNDGAAGLTITAMTSNGDITARSL